MNRSNFLAHHPGRPPRPWITWLLTASIFGVYGIQLLGIRHGVDRVGMTLAVGPSAWEAHRYWKFLTYAWAHAVPLPPLPAYLWLHVFTNTLPLVCVGPALENWFGAWRYLALYLGGAVAAAVAWCAGHPSSAEAMIGASGAVFALFGAGAVIGARLRRVDLFWWSVPLSLDVRTAAIVLCAIEVAQLFVHGWPQVAHLGHLGGAVFGALFAVLISKKNSSPI